MDVIAQLFGINDSSSAIIGATLIDTNTNSGFNQSSMFAPKHENRITPFSGLYLYQAVKEIQNVYKEGSFQTSMLDTWINGFSVNNKGCSSPDMVCSQVADLLDSFSVMKTNQLLKTTDTSLLETVFYFLSFYKNNERILSLDSFSDENKQRLISRGVVCQQWLNNPLNVRYVVRKEGKDGIPAYLYFIGGSRDLLADTANESIESVKNLFSNPMVLKFLQTNQSVDTWRELSNDYMNINNIPIDQRELKRKCAEALRLLCGIIYIRNYLFYAYNYLKIESLIEFNGESIKKVSTKKVLEIYNESYQYCKTIIMISGGKGKTL